MGLTLEGMKVPKVIIHGPPGVVSVVICWSLSPKTKDHLQYIQSSSLSAEAWLQEVHYHIKPGLKVFFNPALEREWSSKRRECNKAFYSWLLNNSYITTTILFDTAIFSVPTPKKKRKI